MVSTEAILKSGRKVTGVVFKGIDDDRMKRLKTQVTESADPQMMVSREGADDETSRSIRGAGTGLRNGTDSG